MSSLLKRQIAMVIAVFVTITLLFTTFLFIQRDEIKSVWTGNSGTSFYKIEQVKVEEVEYNWTVGLSVEEVRVGIRENENNHNQLHQFKEAVDEIIQQRVSLLFLGIYTVLLIVILTLLWRSKESSREITKLKAFLITAICFLSVFIALKYIELNEFIERANYYYYHLL
ncbi:hypothetical protein F9B85_11995 [Heliorestis acidaminivorans]|uniref:Uncharacterized protein n=1 Tax=Heliorestis acidaminivorans TaxID=553427 RepID=A0A6I0ENX2_9FIRM|nr:hypothetical protein [Heliorestis acidaminivorans]KAB2951521.1 hypothetical protein F9B85_11995 [Heliorestis acidaminivorans]